MKVFIVFTAFIMIFSMLICYTVDMNRYIQIQKELKLLAEDCAEAGALTINEKTCKISSETAEKAAEEILRSSNLFPSDKLVISDAAVTENGTGYRITLVYDCGELFRLPFLSVTSVSRISEYAWE